MAPPAKPNIQHTLQLLRQLVRDRKFASAEYVALDLQKSYPKRAECNDALGVVLSAMRKFGEAEPFARRAVAAEPRSAIYAMNLGRILLEIGQVAEAAPLFERALALDPKLFLAAWAMGTFHALSGRGDRALNFYRKTLTLAPEQMQPAVRYELANCLAALGRRAEAEAAHQSNLNVPALRARSISALAALGSYTVDDREFAMVNDELQRPGLNPEERSSLLSQKGAMLGNSGRFAESFTVMQEAKDILRIKPDLPSFGREVDKKIETLNGQTIAHLAGRFGLPSRRLVFIVGMPRSGTTLTEQIAIGHSRIGSAGETDGIERLYLALCGKRGTESFEQVLESVGPERVRRAAANYLDQIDYLAGGKPLIVDKMPHNFRLIGEIAALFPEARIVHCVRHPAASFLSAFQAEMGPVHAYSYRPEYYAEYYAGYARLMRHWDSALPGRIFTMQYEDLTQNPRPVVEKLLAFVGVEWEEACMSFHRKETTVRTLSQLQVRGAINTNSVERWKSYERQIQPVLAKLGRDYPAKWADDWS